MLTPKTIVLMAIRAYQHTLSFDHGPLRHLFPTWGCRFHPTCSEYTFQAVEKYGVGTGLWLGMKRVARCHPGNAGGNDPLI